jgi:hypothetical protein
VAHTAMAKAHASTGRAGTMSTKSRAHSHPRSAAQAGKAAGLSKHQIKQAVRVANVPRDEFERLVESDSPPSVSTLARIGIKANKSGVGAYPSPVKRVVLRLWLTPEQREAIESAAASAGLKPSSWVRSVALKEARHR